MCNAVTKLMAASLIGMAGMSCSSSSDNSGKASALLEEARALCQSGDYKGSDRLLDSLNRTYPREFDVLRRALNIRAMVKEGITVRELAETDSLTAVLAVAVDSLKARLEWVPNQIEGYYAAAGAQLPPTGIEARINPDGVFYIVSSLSGHNVAHSAISLTADGATATSASVPRDGERNRVEGSTEIVHFVGAEADTIGKFAQEHAGRPMTLTFNGTSSFSRPLTMGEQQQLLDVYNYASAMRRLAVAALEHERLERQLATARSQVARTMPDSVPRK